jgi:DNA polymerase I-like protein with 3'-5' exonuclease and polymerase domains
MRLVFDIETDGFLDTLTTIHCIAARNLDNIGQTWAFGPDKIEEGINLLISAEMLAAHNGLTFDIPAIQKLYPWFDQACPRVYDTLVLSRLIRANLKDDDFTDRWKRPDMPVKLFGSHGLEAWGHRLGYHKGDFAKQTDWSTYSEEMLDYCLQDTLVTHRLWTELSPEKWDKRCISLEHRIAKVCHRIGNVGWTFDSSKAGELYAQLSLERTTLEDELQELFPAWTIEETFVPKVNNKKLGYVKGEPFIKTREVTFNPNSRKHIQYCLQQKYGWKPTEFTPSGDAKIDETVLSKLPWPEAQKLGRSFMLQKRIGQLAEGNAAWLRLVDRDGKLRHVINPQGTVTGRMSSFKPNLQQVPAARAEFGAECRELFTVPRGYQLVGADLSGIELRVLAHFLNDGGAYAKELLEGDIHTANMKAAGLSSRDQAKTMIYALCYGAGDQRLGEIIGQGAKAGRALRDKFFAANPAFPKLIRDVKHAVEHRGHLIGLDGRRLHVRGHAALNVLLQSAAALIAKKWLELVDQQIKEEGIDAQIVAVVHDEIQIQVKGDAEYVGRDIACRKAEVAGRFYNIRVPIEAEYSIGRTWRDTH